MDERNPMQKWKNAVFVLTCVLCYGLVLQNQNSVSEKESLNLLENSRWSAIPAKPQSAAEENRKLLAHISQLCSKPAQIIQSHDYQKQCRKYGKHITKDYKLICPAFYLPEYNLVNCFVPKAGSSSVYEHLNQLMPVPRKKRLNKNTNRKVMKLDHNLFRNDKYGSPGMTNNNTFTFMFVRHPLDRLASAFNYRQKSIVKKMKHDNYLSKNNTRMPTFAEFVDYFIVNANNWLTWGDVHFQSMVQRCNPCFLKPNVIGKLETFNRDMSYIIEQAKLPIKLQDSLIHNTGHYEEKRNPNDQLYTSSKPFYAQLTVEKIKHLSQILDQDLSLFDYDIQPFLEMAKDYKYAIE